LQITSIIWSIPEKGQPKDLAAPEKL
jgi:hypothetical protein